MGMQAPDDAGWPRWNSTLPHTIRHSLRGTTNRGEFLVWDEERRGVFAPPGADGTSAPQELQFDFSSGNFASPVDQLRRRTS